MNELIRELVEALEYSGIFSDFLSRAHRDLTMFTKRSPKPAPTLKQEDGHGLRMGCLLFWMATTTLKFGSCFRVGLLIAGKCGLTLTQNSRRWNHPLALRRVHARVAERIGR